MSGMAKLEARIEALAWLEEVLRAEERETISLSALRTMGVLLTEARDLVASDYGQAEPEAEVEPEPHAQPAPIQIITEETKRLAQAALDARDDDEDDDEPEAAAASPVPPAGEGQGEGEPVLREDAERWDKPLRAPAGVIRQWAHKHGITCPAVGLLSAHLLNVINDRRRMMRLRPFVQSATAAGGEA